MDFDLRQVIEGPVELLALQAHQKKIEIVSYVNPGVPYFLQGDPGRLRQILTNLINNAIKFTPPHGDVIVTAEKIHGDQAQTVIRFEVKDTGIGISPETKTRLFSAFTQADSSTVRKYGGTGLGLAISKQLVHLMGGQIGVESELNHGSTFWFTLTFDHQISPRISQPVEKLSSLKGLRVLVVDDNETNRKVVHSQILSWEMRNGCSDSGQTALEILKREALKGDPYDVAILDMQMPEMDGLSLARAIKSNPSTANVCLILLTSIGDLVQNEIKGAGISACLTKPIKQSALFDCLVTNLGHQENQTPRSNPTLKPVIPSQQPIRILVAEDNITNQKIAIMQLAKLGYHAEAVANGREVLTSLSHIPYDLILMDCQMPELDGYETSMEIRKNQNPKKPITIIAMTANALSGDREKCLAAGMNDYISKPVNIDELSKMLSRWSKV